MYDDKSNIRIHAEIAAHNGNNILCLLHTALPTLIIIIIIIKYFIRDSIVRKKIRKLFQSYPISLVTLGLRYRGYHIALSGIIPRGKGGTLARTQLSVQ